MVQCYSEAETALTEAKVFLLNRHPFFGYIALGINVSFDPDTITASVNKSRVSLNPQWFSNLETDQAAGVLAHEIMHVALEHAPRARYKDLTRFNIAADLVINEILTEYKVALPLGAVTRAYVERLVEQKLPAIDDLTVEIVYNLIPEDATGVDIDIEPDGELTEYEHAGLTSNIMLAAEYAKLSSYGTLPGWMEHIVGLSKTTINWRAIIAMFVSSCLTSGRTYRHPNKRYQYSGLVLPGQYDYTPNLVCVVDASGSIDASDLNMFINEVFSAARLMDATVRMIVHDTAVTLDRVVGPNDIPNIRIRGRGGTDFRCVTNLLDKDAANIDGVVWLTDGYGPYNYNPPQYPVLWILNNPNAAGMLWGWTARLG